VYYNKSYKIVFISLLVNLTIFTWLFESPFGAGDNWAHFRNGQMFLKQKNYSAAENNFNYYLRNANMHARMAGVAHFGLGLLYQDMGQEHRAVKEYSLAVKNDLHPDYSIKDKAFMNLGAIYMKRKDYKDAIYAYSKAVEHNQNNGFAHYYLGLAFFKSGSYEKAEEESVKAKNLGVSFTFLSEQLNELKKSSAKKHSKE
jgi:tetratricopeptide (TPR) repeat protein